MSLYTLVKEPEDVFIYFGQGTSGCFCILVYFGQGTSLYTLVKGPVDVFVYLLYTLVKGPVDVFIYVVHLRDRLFSCQLCGANTPRFPLGGEGMR